MSQEQWTAVDRYLTEVLVCPDAALDAALRANAEAGLPAHDVSPAQGKLLELLVRMHGARRVLEIGTLGGYSTICLARGLLPGGRVITLEADPVRAQIAATNLERANLSEVVEVRVGPALETLPKLRDEGVAPFDFIFIDADKPNNPRYLEWALALSRPGSVIVADNVIRGGAVIDGNDSDANVRGIRRFNELIAQNPRLSATAIQTVGSKGYDGFAIAIVSST
jgi:predicted O-methyltransferase YrrM